MSYKIHEYFKNTEKFISLLNKKNENFWSSRGEKKFIELFSLAKKTVPAYREFLKENNVFEKKIKKSSDFSLLPTLDKANYLRKFDFKSLVQQGSFPKGNWVVSATSGSTGEPFYFPRKEEQDLYYALTAEIYLRTNFEIHNRKTLYVNGFALGVWIGGLFTYQSIKHILDKNKYDLTVINPGINKEEMLKAIVKLSPYYDQVIIGGYPPFLKDFVDFANQQGFNWDSIAVKFIFSAEGFSEDFRNYIAKNTKLKDIYKDTLNHYGTVDLGTMAYETPFSVLIRRIAVENKSFFDAIFGEGNRLPTLCQYIPEHFYFEETNGQLFCTSNSGIPLVRYDLKDLGGVKKFSDIMRIALENGIDLKEEAKKVGIADTVWQLPFVYVFERSDFSISIYGANIYPENIRSVFLQEEFEQYLSGRFTLQVEYSENQDPIFMIHAELKTNTEPEGDLSKRLGEMIFEKLIKCNSEYNTIYQNTGEKVMPKIKFWNSEEGDYFKRGGKQKWVVK